ncbi:hypothetical protein D3C81_2085220 [compost metagenome]
MLPVMMIVPLISWSSFPAPWIGSSENRHPTNPILSQLAFPMNFDVVAPGLAASGSSITVPKNQTLLQSFRISGVSQ